MFEKTQEAANKLGAAVTEDATQALAVAKAVVIPAVSGFFSKIANAAQTVAEGVEDGSLFKPAAAPEPKADPLPTPEQNAAIASLRALGKTDEEIAQTVGVSVLTVKMATPVEG
jgi:DNA-binding NarL/FixJ family response regulator